MFHFLDQPMKKQSAMFLVLASSSVYGLLWIPLRIIEEFGLTGIWSGLFFTFVPVPLLCWLFGKNLLADRKHWRVYFFAGTAIGIGWMCYTLGLILGSVTKTTLLFYLTPVWSSLLGLVFLKEKPKLMLWIANFLGLAGCALIFKLSPSSLVIDQIDLLGLASGIFWSIGSVIIKGYPNADYKNTTLVQYFAGTMVGLIAVYSTGLSMPPLSSFANALPLTAFVSIVIILPPLMIIFRLTQYISPTILGILMLSEVFVAVVTASIFLGEYMSPSQWLGAGMIILTALLVTFSERKET